MNRVLIDELGKKGKIKRYETINVDFMVVGVDVDNFAFTEKNTRGRLPGTFTCTVAEAGLSY